MITLLYICSYGFMSGISLVVFDFWCKAKEMEETEAIIPLYIFSALAWPFFLPMWFVLLIGHAVYFYHKNGRWPDAVG